MANTKQAEFFVLTEQDQELKRFFDRVRVAGKIAVRDGSDEFIVEFRRATLSDEARKRLTEGGPGNF